MESPTPKMVNDDKNSEETQETPENQEHDQTGGGKEDRKQNSMAFTIDFGEPSKQKVFNLPARLREKSFVKNDKGPRTPLTYSISQQPKSLIEAAPTSDLRLTKMDKENNNNHLTRYESIRRKNQGKEFHSMQYQNSYENKDLNDGASDAGTYTIEEDLKQSDTKCSTTVENLEKERAKINAVFGVEKSDLEPHELVSTWTMNHSVSSTTGSLSPPPQSLIDREDAASRVSRRRLPATPDIVQVSSSPSASASLALRKASTDTYTKAGSVHSAVSSQKTFIDEPETMLKDTLSCMASMEARLSANNDVQSPRALVRDRDLAVVKKRQTVKTPNIIQQQEKKIAWERRKNYDPIQRSGLKNKMTTHHAHSQRVVHMTDTSDSCSESNSEVTEGRGQVQRQGDIMTSSLPLVIKENLPSFGKSNGPARHASPKYLPNPTRPNRAFDLRKKINQVDTVSEMGSKPKTFLSPREEVLRTNKIKPPTKKEHPTIRAARKSDPGSARSNSTLTSKEAEFQAWKRRANYNPRLAVAKAANTKKESNRSRIDAAVPTDHSSIQNSDQAASPRLLNLSESNGFMHRSASFHYPESDILDQENTAHQSFFGADEEKEEDRHFDLWSRQSPRCHDIVEINEDEFVLAIGDSSRFGGGTPSENVSAAAAARKMSMERMSNARSSERRSNVGKMEALDNLVISTINSMSTKLCLKSASIIRKVMDRVPFDEEQNSIMDTLLYVLEDTDLPVSPTKQTTRELAGTLKNMKKLEQALSAIEGNVFPDDEATNIENEALNDNQGV